MKSKRAEKYIEEHRDKHPYPSGDFSAGAAFEAVELAEEEMAETACRLFEQFMSGVFQGDTPKKMAQEFKQKLMEI